jgi:hypothetical protein
MNLDCSHETHLLTAIAFGGGLFGSSGTAKKDENKKDGIPAGDNAPGPSFLMGLTLKYSTTNFYTLR